MYLRPQRRELGELRQRMLAPRKGCERCVMCAHDEPPRVRMGL